MKPSTIKTLLDISWRARKNNKRLYPLFISPPGIGKSSIVQQWCNEREIKFIDYRTAYKDNVDAIGLPYRKLSKDGTERTAFAPPQVWPTEGEGVIFLDEINRGQSSVQNCTMQMLTDHKIEDLVLAPGWMFVAAINPENGDYEVNQMDPALKNRFVMYNIEFDKQDFINYMKSTNYDPLVIAFVESVWEYKKPEEIQDKNGALYSSPRSIEQLDTAFKEIKELGINSNIEHEIYCAIMGDFFGTQFYALRHKETPVFVSNLIENLDHYLAVLERYSNPKDVKGSLIEITCKDFVSNWESMEENNRDNILTSVCGTIPADKAVALLKELAHKYETERESLIPRIMKNKKLKSKLSYSLLK